jgi:hypothetical protein
MTELLAVGASQVKVIGVQVVASGIVLKAKLIATEEGAELIRLAGRWVSYSVTAEG